MKVKEGDFLATEKYGPVSYILNMPEDAHCLYIFGHGAASNMRHGFMEDMVGRLNKRGMATFRYQFPYMERGLKGPDRPPILMETVHSACRAAREHLGDLPIFAGGKSMSGRMTSNAAAVEPLAHVRGLIFVGFPLHSAGKPGTERGTHLQKVTIPMLFLQGTRDKLALLDLLNPVVEKLGELATLKISEASDHSFKVLKRSGRDPEQVLDELAVWMRDWTREIIAKG